MSEFQYQLFCRGHMTLSFEERLRQSTLSQEQIEYIIKQNKKQIE